MQNIAQKTTIRLRSSNSTLVGVTVKHQLACSVRYNSVNKQQAIKKTDNTYEDQRVSTVHPSEHSYSEGGIVRIYIRESVKCETDFKTALFTEVKAGPR